MLNKKLTPRKTLLALALAPAVLGFTAQTAQAQSVDQKVADLEAQLQALKSEVAASKTAATSASGTQFTFGGFIKMDALYSMYSNGNRATASIGDDFYIPSTVPTDPSADSGEKFDMHAKQSRFNVKGVSDTSAGKVTGFLEIDFQLSSQGDERISNSYAPRLRHAYLSWDYNDNSSLLAGQTWSTFFNVGALPNTVDFVGPAGTIFVRQTQMRWSKKLAGGGGFHFALENPSTGLNGGSNNYDDSVVPDVALRFDGKSGSNFSYSIAGLGRDIRYRQANGSEESAFGYGLSGSAIWKFGADDLKIMLNYGNALGRYMGLQSFRDGSIAPDGSVELNDQVGGFITYKHAWNDQWRSSIVLSASQSENPDFLAGSATPKAYQSGHLNLIYSPTKKINLGGELIYGSKELENGDDGSLNRIQFMAMYSF